MGVGTWTLSITKRALIGKCAGPCSHTQQPSQVQALALPGGLKTEQAWALAWRERAVILGLASLLDSADKQHLLLYLLGYT